VSPRLDATAAPAPSPQEATAIVAAIERFVRDTAAPPGPPPTARPDAWHAAALIDGVSRDPWARAHDPWVDDPRSLP